MSGVHRPTLRFMLGHPARVIALGFGAGLAPWAPGTVGTLWAWAAYLVIERWFGPQPWGYIVLVGTAVGLWACTRCQQHMQVGDPGAIVWDEVLAFWLILWVLSPIGLLQQLLAFGLFRFFDAVKPQPVAWADALFDLKPGAPISWRHGFGNLLDDFVAAGCTLVTWALGLALWRAI
jgi:phosphatidylglycerophosphatase A